MRQPFSGARAAAIFAEGQRVHAYFDPAALRWRPGYPVPEGVSPDAVVALTRHAEAAEQHEREQAARRPTWQKRRAA